jgi:glyoxylase-like metal-dependent hydrolase (beta-lactamase superfamily II)
MLRATTQPVSRRNFLHVGAFALTATLPSSVKAGERSTQPINDAAKMRAEGALAKISVAALRRNVSVLMGSGGNIAVLPGQDGKVLVDAGYATSRKQIRQALDGLSKDPIKHLIDTHWHFDHTDGNDWIHQAGATIISHEQTRRRLIVAQEIPAFNGVFPPSPEGALPAVVFSDQKTLDLNREEVFLEHYASAHSDSDISVRFVRANVLHTGDTWFNGFYPFIDYFNGGSLSGMLAASAHNLRVTDNQTILVPGHGPIGGRAQLAEYDVMLRLMRDRVAALKKQGRSVEEAVAAKPSSEFDAKWGGGLVPPNAFVELIYAGVQL